MSQWASRGKVTKTLIGINVLVFIAQYTSHDAVTSLLALYSSNAYSAPWTLITSGFAHADPIHILLNMYSLWIFGEAIENSLGAKRFVWLYLLSILGGSIVFTFTDPLGIAVGASGGIFLFHHHSRTRLPFVANARTNSHQRGDGFCEPRYCTGCTPWRSGNRRSNRLVLYKSSPLITSSGWS